VGRKPHASSESVKGVIPFPINYLVGSRGGGHVLRCSMFFFVNCSATIMVNKNSHNIHSYDVSTVYCVSYVV